MKDVQKYKKCQCGLESAKTTRWNKQNYCKACFEELSCIKEFMNTVMPLLPNKKNNAVTVKELTKRCGVNEGTLSSYLFNLFQIGTVNRYKKGFNGRRQFVYYRSDGIKPITDFWRLEFDKIKKENVELKKELKTYKDSEEELNKLRELYRVRVNTDETKELQNQINEVELENDELKKENLELKAEAYDLLKKLNKDVQE
jgi:predicted transcriptional regulator